MLPATSFTFSDLILLSREKKHEAKKETGTKEFSTRLASLRSPFRNNSIHISRLYTPVALPHCSDTRLYYREKRETGKEAGKVDRGTAKTTRAFSRCVSHALLPLRRYGSPHCAAPTVLRSNIYSPFRAS